jgi:hypothetical protein
MARTHPRHAFVRYARKILGAGSNITHCHTSAVEPVTPCSPPVSISSYFVDSARPRHRLPRSGSRVERYVHRRTFVRDESCRLTLDAAWAENSAWVGGGSHVEAATIARCCVLMLMPMPIHGVLLRHWRNRAAQAVSINWAEAARPTRMRLLSVLSGEDDDRIPSPG